MNEDNDESEVEVKSKIYERMPVNDMIKKGWIKKYHDVNDLKKIFMHFWELNEFNYKYIDNLVLPITRKSEAFSSFNKYYLLTWTQMAKQYSEKLSTDKFDRKCLSGTVKKLSEYSVQKNGVVKFLNDLTGSGVKFICLSHLPKTYLDGASFLHNNSPVIVYTKRYDRLDNFWFTIAHEIGHILYHVKSEKDMFVDDLKVHDKSSIEKEADEFASIVLKAKEILEYFKEYKQYTSEFRVLAASNELNIHPSIIVGTLRFHNILSYNRLNKLNETVSDKIPKKYLVEN